MNDYDITIFDILKYYYDFDISEYVYDVFEYIYDAIEDTLN